MAVLELLAGTAWAFGVAADGLAPFLQIGRIDVDHFGGTLCGGEHAGGQGRAEGIEVQRRAGFVLAGGRIDVGGDERRQFLRRFVSLQRELCIGQHARHVFAHILQHAFEQGEGFALIFVDRRLLGIGAQVDDRTQRIQRGQMLLPVMIERLQQEAFFDADPGFGRQFGGLGGHQRIGLFDQAIDDDFGIDALFLGPGRNINRQAQCARHVFLQARHIPLFGVAAERAAGGNDGVHAFMAHVDHDIADGFRIHHVGALFIDHLALVVHHVVVLQQLLAHVVVAGFHLFLGGFDGFRNPRVDDRLALFQAGVHQAGQHVLLAEDAQQIIVERQVET